MTETPKIPKIRKEEGRGRKIRRAKHPMDHPKDAIRKPPKISQYALGIIVVFASSHPMARGVNVAFMFVGSVSSLSHSHRASIDRQVGARSILLPMQPPEQKKFHRSYPQMSVIM